jgi:hypothetical protein
MHTVPHSDDVVFHLIFVCMFSASATGSHLAIDEDQIEISPSGNSLCNSLEDNLRNLCHLHSPGSHAKTHVI